MSKSDNLDALGDLTMKAVIISADAALVAKVNATLQRVGRQPQVSVQWTAKHWPMDAMTQSGIVGESLVDATDAHLIIIPAVPAHCFPCWLRHWLERWAALRQIQGAALAVIGGGADAGFTQAVSPELFLFARKHELNFITNQDPADNDSVILPVNFSDERELPLPVGRSGFAGSMTSGSFRGFGINE
jgi:hypothetical protein